MYCQGSETGVRDWVATVQRLRYKDFQLVKKPAEKQAEGTELEKGSVAYGKLEEVESVKEFGGRMEDFGVWKWWRIGMGKHFKNHLVLRQYIGKKNMESGCANRCILSGRVGDLATEGMCKNHEGRSDVKGWLSSGKEDSTS
ncbi:Nn.00g093830.m01.CDS01 [Neocucurbitaria sp. VM-36]